LAQIHSNSIWKNLLGQKFETDLVCTHKIEEANSTFEQVKSTSSKKKINKLEAEAAVACQIHSP